MTFTTDLAHRGMRPHTTATFPTFLVHILPSPDLSFFSFCDTTHTLSFFSLSSSDCPRGTSYIVLMSLSLSMFRCTRTDDLRSCIAAEISLQGLLLLSS